MAMRPVGDKVLVQRVVATKTNEGIILPNKVTTNEGEVIAIGDGILQNGIRQPSLVKVGDRITWQGGHIQVQTDESFVLVPETAILLVLN